MYWSAGAELARIDLESGGTLNSDAIHGLIDYLLQDEPTASGPIKQCFTVDTLAMLKQGKNSRLSSDSLNQLIAKAEDLYSAKIVSALGEFGMGYLGIKPRSDPESSLDNQGQIGGNATHGNKPRQSSSVATEIDSSSEMNQEWKVKTEKIGDFKLQIMLYSFSRGRSLKQLAFKATLDIEYHTFSPSIGIVKMEGSETRLEPSKQPSEGFDISYKASFSQILPGSKNCHQIIFVFGQPSGLHLTPKLENFLIDGSSVRIK